MTRASLTLAVSLRLSRRRASFALLVVMTTLRLGHLSTTYLTMPSNTRPVCRGQSISRRRSHLRTAYARRALSARCALARISRVLLHQMHSDTYSGGGDDTSTNAEAADVLDRVSSWGLEASLSLAIEAL